MTQGGPCSPVLFNIYNDELARRLHSNFVNPDGLSPGRFYADDVIVHVASMCDLQAALQLCSTWAQEFGMTWELKKGKSQVLLSSDRARRYPSFAFAGGKIDTVTNARYLGVTITTTEILEESAIKRIQNAHMTWTQLKAAKVLYCGMDAKYALMVFRSLLQSGIDYACFLSPWGQKTTEAYNSLMLRFFGNVLGMRVRVSQLPRILAIFDLDSIGLRRPAIANRLATRMKEQCKDESDGEQRARMQAMNTLRDLTLSIPCRRLIGNTNRPIAEEELAAIRKRTRNFLLDKMKRPMVLGKGLYLAFRLPNSKHRRLAIRWHLGTFPIHYRFLRRIGLQRILDHMVYLAKKKLEPQEQISLRIALDTISCIPEVPSFV